ncbi:MAG: hypothetical protein G01um101425_778 [Candidatus Peregrinibacteria bacterium Gr01-1014_25]|nr:MAG: hypothetical protein G01um101425_778 [Candidatus Peregrinibacteria bacterium Gr01-1014_25]
MECAAEGNALCAAAGKICLQYSTPPCAVCGDVPRAEETLAEAILRQAFCGNGRIEVGEACDDGNARNGDGCSAFCGKDEERATSPLVTMLGTMAPVVPTLDGALSAGTAPRLGIREFVFGRAAAPSVAGSSTQEFFMAPPVHAPVGDTGPAAVAVMAAGAAAGWSWVRRRRKA